MKKLLLIALLIVGCSLPLICNDIYIDIIASDLQMDNNGYHHMEYLGSHTQTFTTLEAETGITNYTQKVKWISDTEILILFISDRLCINTASSSFTCPMLFND